jgi:nucleoside 2-deoxyribosyltransferase
MWVYLAARYSRHPEMRGYAARLRAMGHEVTSRWIEGGHEMSREATTEEARLERQRFAEEDLDDLNHADVLIAFTEPARIPTVARGGRHVEFGVALRGGKRLVVIGPEENVFYSLPCVNRYDTWSDFIAADGLGGR